MLDELDTLLVLFNYVGVAVQVLTTPPIILLLLFLLSELLVFVKNEFYSFIVSLSVIF